MMARAPGVCQRDRKRGGMRWERFRLSCAGAEKL